MSTRKSIHKQGDKKRTGGSERADGDPGSHSVTGKSGERGSAGLLFVVVAVGFGRVAFVPRKQRRLPRSGSPRKPPMGHMWRRHFF